MAWGMPPLPRRISKPRLSEITFLALKIAKDLAHRKKFPEERGVRGPPGSSPNFAYAFVCVWDTWRTGIVISKCWLGLSSTDHKLNFCLEEVWPKCNKPNTYAYMSFQNLENSLFIFTLRLANWVHCNVWQSCVCLFIYLVIYFNWLIKKEKTKFYWQQIHCVIVT